MASYQFVPDRRPVAHGNRIGSVDNFISRVRAADPLWYRAGEMCIAVAIVVSNLFSDALEDGAARIAARFRRFQ